MSCYLKQFLQVDAKANGNGTALEPTAIDNECVNILVMQVTGITTATINWEATVDGVNWVAVLATNLTTGTAATTTAANGLFRLDCTALAQVRARISGYDAGTINVLALAAEL